MKPFLIMFALVLIGCEKIPQVTCYDQVTTDSTWYTSDCPTPEVLWSIESDTTVICIDYEPENVSTTTYYPAEFGEAEMKVKTDIIYNVKP